MAARLAPTIKNIARILPSCDTVRTHFPTVPPGQQFVLFDSHRYVTRGLPRKGLKVWQITGDSVTGKLPANSVAYVDTLTDPTPGDLIAVNLDGLTCIRKFRFPFLVVTKDHQFDLLGVVVGVLSIY